MKYMRVRSDHYVVNLELNILHQIQIVCTFLEKCDFYGAGEGLVKFFQK